MAKILLFFLLFLTFKCQNHTQLVIGSPILGKILYKNDKQFYKLSLKEPLNPNNYLIFYLHDDSNTDPDMFISTTNEYPNSTSKDLYCNSFGTDVCVIPPKDLKEQEYYLTVSSYQKQANFTLIIFFVRENILNNDILINETIDLGQVALFKYRVPNNSKIESVSIKLEIMSFYKTKVFFSVSNSNSNISTSAIKNTIPTLAGYSYKSYKNDTGFCVDCDLYAILISEQKTNYTILASTSESIILISEKAQPIIDSVKLKTKNCYLYNVKYSSNDFIIRLNVFSGDPEIYVNPNFKPENLSEFLFSSLNFGSEELVITVKQKVQVQTPSGPYYICIYGENTSSYSLVIVEDNLKYPELYNGFSITSYAKSNELIIYSFTPDNFSSENIEFKLRSVSGNVDLYIKNCSKNIQEKSVNPECTLEKNQLNNTEIISTRSQIITEIKDIRTDKLMLNNSNIACPNRKICYYLVGVLAHNDINSKFTLTAIETSTRTFPLKAGEPTFGTVNLQAYDYYAYTNSDPDVIEIKFQLSTLAGDSDLYSSRNQTLLLDTRKYAEKQARGTSYLPDIIIYNSTDKNILTTFYLAVLGYTVSSYYLEVIISKNGTNGTEENTIHTIFEGDPLMYVLPEEVSFTIFSIDLFDFQFQELKIMLTPNLGHFEIYLGLGFIPTKQKYTERTSDYSVVFNHNIIHNETVLYIRIEKIGFYNIQTSFSIVFNRQNTLINLYDGVSMKGLIKNNESEYYKFLVLNNSSPIKLSLVSFTGLCTMYVSTNSSNLFPDQNVNNYKTGLMENLGHITISSNDVKKYYSNCNSSKDISLCQVYISVSTRSQSCLFSITVSQSMDSLIMLSEGQIQTGSVRLAEIDYYYFQVVNSSDYLISLVSYEVEAIMSLADLNSKEREWVLPTKANYFKKSLTNGNQEIIEVEKSTFNICLKCVLLIGVSLKKNNEGNISNYNIIVHSSLIYLIDNQPILGFVSPKNYRYYGFYVPCEMCDISIYLIPASSCNPDLYIKRNWPPLPNEENYDFKSDSLIGEYFTINSSNTFFTIDQKSFSGYYVLGVYSNTECNYFISASTNQSPFIEIYSGLLHPVKQSINFQTFFFKNTQLNKFKISLQVKSGTPILRSKFAESISDESKFLENIPFSEEQATWSSLKSSTPFSIDFNLSGTKTLKGYYICTVECKGNCDYSIVVQDTNLEYFTLIPANKPFRDSIGIGKNVNLYKLLSVSSNHILIQSTTITGKIHLYIDITPSVSNLNYKWHGEGNGIIEITSEEMASDNNYTYYLYVEGIPNSHYTLLISKSDTKNVLIEGIPQFVTLKKEGEIRHFIYDCTHEFMDSIETIKVGFSLKSLNSEFVPEIYISFYSPDNEKQPNMPDESFHDYKYNISTSSSKEVSANFESINSKQAIMAITVKAKFLNTTSGKSISGNFQITAYSSHTIILTQNVPVESSFSKLNDYQIFEIFESYADKIQIMLTPCLGEFRFKVLTKDSNSNLKEVKLEMEYLKSKIIIGQFENTFDQYSINVMPTRLESLEGFNLNQKGVFSIEFKGINIMSLPPPTYEAGNLGLLNVKIEGGLIKLTWSKIFENSIGSNGLIEANIYNDSFYSVYASENLEGNLETPCGIKHSGSILVGTLYNQTELAFERPFNKDFRLNVVAHPTSKDTIIYDSIFVSGSFRMRSWFRWSSLFYMTLVLGLVIIIVILYKKLKYTQQKLEYEIRDVREIIPVTETIAISKAEEEGYNKLNITDK